MKCPVDGFELKSKSIEGIDVDYCEKCSGFFLKKGELKRIAHQTPGDIEYSSFEHAEDKKLTDQVCPLCVNEQMYAVNFIEYSDIALKYCHKCGGVWLEKDELDMINNEIDKLNDNTEHWEHAFRVFLSKLPF